MAVSYGIAIFILFLQVKGDGDGWTGKIKFISDRHEIHTQSA